ncbi:DUF4652 domain-containing protein [Bacillus sp. B-jedd]|uniref:DUF4652 domain-containing protein n=1 Tax=Bacillus sp. B-jedd TaxID=1476857 RepID=UPI0005155A34|nr:DUF4652 domain-containing protein [Bacillus sp. B-jedd]CEG26023.1 hypothetical protein BN1002_00861 [Bacillus sp. B-jedd]
MYKLIFDENRNEIIQVDSKGKETVITDNSPSIPEYSPDEKFAAYISPLEWEEWGSLYLYNLETGYITELVKPDERGNIPKFITWLSNAKLAVIIGFGDGTVQVGGNVYTFDITENSLIQISNYPDSIQITRLTLDGAFLDLEGIQYVDEAYSEYQKFKDKILLDEIL